ncbi:MAG: PIN domain-containing protein [Candidatus Woesearchaeota archaeon]
MHFIAFDTNIYREFGVKLNKNINFDYLTRFIEKGPHEIVLLDLVYKELLDYFKNDYLGKLISDYQSVYLRFEKNEFVENIDLIDLTSIEKKAISEYKASLKKSAFKSPKPIIDYSLLSNFLIYNKWKHRKDNTRDFLIWLQLIELAKSNPDDKIIFISKDKIFTEDSFFKNTLYGNMIKNIEVMESISKYLSDYGLQVDFLNDKLVLEFVPISMIKKELKNDIECLPSYVSKYYATDEIKPPQNISLEILNIELNDYYSYSENKGQTILVANFIVSVKAIFDKELKVNLMDYEQDHYYEEIKHRIDSENRPIYENKILFIFEGDIDFKNKKITNQRFIDFIPDWNVK